MSGERGQAVLLVTAGLAAVLIGTLGLAAVARGLGGRSADQRAADLGALAGARAMLAAYPEAGREAYLARGRSEAVRVARLNGARAVTVGFPGGDDFAPMRIRVRVGETSAVAELAPPGGISIARGGGYAGPLAERQGKRMRPDVAVAFDRMNAAARADGVHLIITSAFRSDAEQAVLWARRPDPRWVARPGTSLHRLGTELDLGPPSAYGWLAANAPRFRFVKRYPHEPWHWGFNLNAGSAPARADGALHRAVPAFVPPRFAGALADAAQRWNVSATLLAAQIHAESGFNPFAVSRAGAQGIAQFMPATARAYGLRDPHDPRAAIDAQAHLMRDLLRQFASVPLALAAYNAGPSRVRACMCVPPIPETRAYVARILGLMGGAGDASGGAVSIRLVE